MRLRTLLAFATATMLWTGAASAQTKESAMNSTPPATAPVIAKDHAALLASDDPKLAANKRLVYDMYRIVLQAGIWERAGEFIGMAAFGESVVDALLLGFKLHRRQGGFGD